MSMQFSVLASGSTGNATYIETEDHSILVDAGLSGKQMDKLFQQIGRDPANLDAILRHTRAFRPYKRGRNYGS